MKFTGYVTRGCPPCNRFARTLTMITIEAGQIGARNTVELVVPRHRERNYPIGRVIEVEVHPK